MKVTGKQREIIEREGRILEVARGMLLDGGYHKLSMERIAEELQYAKGTIYNHFKNKETIVIALAIQTMNIRTEMFNRAALFKGLPRERIMAIGTAAETFVRNYPDHFKVEMLIRSSAIWEKTTEERRQLMQSCESRCINIVAGVVRDGIAQGHLSLSPEIIPEELVFGLWSMNYGSFSIMATSTYLGEMGLTNPQKSLQRNMDIFLDGYNWQPLSKDHDYGLVLQRIKKEVFPLENGMPSVN